MNCTYRTPFFLSVCSMQGRGRRDLAGRRRHAAVWLAARHARKGQQRRLARPSRQQEAARPGRQQEAAAAWLCTQGADGAAQVHGPGTGCGVRTVEAQEIMLQRRTTKIEEAPSAMVVPRRRRKREVRETMNGNGFAKRMARRCRGRRDLPRGGDGLCRNATVSPENLAEKFAGNLAVPNFGVRSAGLRAAARKTGCTFGISASSPTPAYIYV